MRRLEPAAPEGALSLSESTTVRWAVIFVRTNPGRTTITELALWLGVSKTDLPLVLPNISRFYNLTGSTAPLGFLL